MNSDEIKAVFDKQAATYNKQWEKMAPINEALYFFFESIFSKLGSQAKILCVGVGTGSELIYLAKKFPKWTFTAVEPSGEMLAICRSAVDEAGFTERCTFHEGFLDSLPANESHDGATSFLVSHFIMEREVRVDFFRQIAKNLKPKGILLSSDLAADTHSSTYESLLNLWLKRMSNSDVSDEVINNIKQAYSKDVALIPSSDVAKIIETGGFNPPTQFFQLGMINAFFSERCESGKLS